MCFDDIWTVHTHCVFIFYWIVVAVCNLHTVYQSTSLSNLFLSPKSRSTWWALGECAGPCLQSASNSTKGIWVSTTAMLVHVESRDIRWRKLAISSHIDKPNQQLNFVSLFFLSLLLSQKLHPTVWKLSAFVDRIRVHPMKFVCVTNNRGQITGVPSCHTFLEFVSQIVPILKKSENSKLNRKNRPEINAEFSSLRFAGDFEKRKPKPIFSFSKRLFVQLERWMKLTRFARILISLVSYRLWIQRSN